MHQNTHTHTMVRAISNRALIPSYSVVDTAEEKEFFWNRLMECWRVRNHRSKPATFSPVSNPCSIGRSDVKMLKSHPYSVTLKSDGVRYILFLTIRPGPDKKAAVALMIDRARNMYEVEVVATEDHFLKGTVLEGELVWHQPDERGMDFYIFDAIMVRGESFTNQPFSKRLHVATQCVKWSAELNAQGSDLEKHVAETESVAMVHFEPPVSMMPKCFVDLQHVERLWNDRHESKHRVDGLILQRDDAPYIVGTAKNGTIFKWKEHHSVDLSSREGELYVLEGKLDPVLHGRRVKIAESRICADDDQVLEYHVAVTGEEIIFMAMRCRPDKLTPNSAKVVLATVQNVIEDIRPEQLRP